MEALSLLCVLSYCVVATVVAIRMLRMAAVTGAIPELTIGSGLLLGSVIGYPATVLSAVLAEAHPDASLRAMLAGTVALYLCSWALLVAWHGIFHRGERWARWAASVVTAVLFLALIDRLAGAARAGGIADITVAPSAAVYVSIACQAIPYLLMAISGTRYYARLRRQLALGLGDPVVANRIALWTGTAAVVVVQYTYALATLAHQTDPVVVSLSRVVIGVLGLTLATLLWLAFFPPAAWLRRIRGGERQEPMAGVARER